MEILSWLKIRENLFESES